MSSLHINLRYCPNYNGWDIKVNGYELDCLPPFEEDFNQDKPNIEDHLADLTFEHYDEEQGELNMSNVQLIKSIDSAVEHFFGEDATYDFEFDYLSS